MSIALERRDVRGRSAVSSRTRRDDEPMARDGACRRNRLEMLLEIIPSKVAPVTDDTSARIIQRFYDIGVYPDWWKLEPFTTDAAWEKACAASVRTTPRQ